MDQALGNGWTWETLFAGMRIPVLAFSLSTQSPGSPDNVPTEGRITTNTTGEGDQVIYARRTSPCGIGRYDFGSLEGSQGQVGMSSAFLLHVSVPLVGPWERLTAS